MRCTQDTKDFGSSRTQQLPSPTRNEGNSFFGHLSMMGGMLFVVAFGAGAYSIDALINRSPTGEVTARRVRSF
jgi:uncharacterized membrane protein YphA (DoxX/SURF4 family)